MVSPNILNLLLDAVCMVDAQGRFLWVSAAAERIFGYPPHEMVGRVMIDMVLPEDRSRTLQAAAAIMSGNQQLHFENRYVRKDGQVANIQWSASWSERDQCRIAVAHDITERKYADLLQAAIYAISEAAFSANSLAALLQSTHEIIQSLMPATHFAVALHDANTDVLAFAYYANQQYAQPAPGPLSNDARCAEVVRTGQALLITPQTLVALPAHLQQPGADEAPYWLGVPLCAAGRTLGLLVLQGYGEDAHYAEKDRDLLQFVSAQIAAAIERQQLHARLQHMALYDQLTHLPNRALFHDRLATALARSRREQAPFALLFIDLDKFKSVNDTLGHAAGDLLLQLVAGRLTECIRESDTVARLGGDEFVVLLESGPLASHVINIAEKIRAAFVTVFKLPEHDLTVTPSMGMAMYPEHGDDAKQLLAHADKSMYEAKKKR